MANFIYEIPFECLKLECRFSDNAVITYVVGTSPEEIIKSGPKCPKCGDAMRLSSRFQEIVVTI